MYLRELTYNFDIFSLFTDDHTDGLKGDENRILNSFLCISFLFPINFFLTGPGFTPIPDADFWLVQLILNWFINPKSVHFLEFTWLESGLESCFSFDPDFLPVFCPPLSMSIMSRRASSSWTRFSAARTWTELPRIMQRPAYWAETFSLSTYTKAPVLSFMIWIFDPLNRSLMSCCELFAHS